jgi:type IV secretory pathway VirB4 component
MSGPSIQVIVGSDDSSRTFKVFRDLITSRSKFFENALNSRWAESDDGAVKLPEDGFVVFEQYLQLLYLNTVPIREKVEVYATTGNKSDTTHSKKKTQRSKEEILSDITQAAIREYTSIMDLYILCDQLQDTQSKNLVLTAMVEA